MDMLHNSKYQTITYDPSDGVLRITWKSSTFRLTESEFKEEVSTYLEIVKVHRPPKTFWDLRDLQFVVDPELQQWIDTEVTPGELGIVKKQALLMPHDFVANISVDQIVQGENNQKIPTKMANDEEAIVAWLSKQKEDNFW